MPTPNVVSTEQRNRALQAYGLDALEDDPELAKIVNFASKLCDVPIALVSLVEEERQRFLARKGLNARETPRSSSFCAHAMLLGSIMEVRDAMRDERFHTNPLVTGPPNIRFYAGQPLRSPEGVPLGALCVIDHHPRPEGLTEFQREGMAVLADAVMRRLRSRRETLAAKQELEYSEGQFKALADSIPAIAWSSDANGNFEYFNKRLIEFTGVDPDRTTIHPDDLLPMQKAWAQSLEKGEEFERELRLQRHDGEYRWMMARTVPVKTATGKIIRWFGTAVDVDELHRISESRDLLAKELSHRIKNIFAVVAGLISLSIRRKPEHKDFGEELVQTIRALGRAHDFVRPAQHAADGKLQGLLEELFAPYGTDEYARIKVTGDEVKIGSRAVTPLALVFHELATNSAKYGALSIEEGLIDLEIIDEGDMVSLLWREKDAPPGELKTAEGFGSRLIDMSVSGQLAGSWNRRWEGTGLFVELHLSKKALAA
ncbi:PAS domain-containing protein [Altererythrobacter indicus]|uniref:histidine kinase n=1 Tax=Altericroceibacterium indicum TaxID=374177 RepID=A0A845AAL8_9SPHN|nr:PAS domain-containing protein [Altericroceibacterium indicum]